jgi:hypothetical protein
MVDYVTSLCKIEGNSNFTNQKERSAITIRSMVDTCDFLSNMSSALLPTSLENLAPLQVELRKVNSILQTLLCSNASQVQKKQEEALLIAGKCRANIDSISTDLYPTEFADCIEEVVFLCNLSSHKGLKRHGFKVNQSDIYSTYLYIEQLAKNPFPYLFQGNVECQRLLEQLTNTLRIALKEAATAQLLKSSKLSYVDF